MHKNTHGSSLRHLALGKRYGETVHFAIALITMHSFLDKKKNNNNKNKSLVQKISSVSWRTCLLSTDEILCTVMLP